MKQYIRTLMLAVALAPVFSSCDYLDKEPDDMLTLDAVFDNADYTKQWLAGVYNLVPDPLWEYMTYEGYGYYMMSDETQMASSLSQFGWSNLMNVQKGSWTPTTIVPGKNLWLETYRKVRAGLIFMENVKEIPNQRQTAELVERYKNEVRFLMAYYYSRMLEVYGPFPLVTSLVDVTESGDVLQKARTPYDEIVDYLDNEFMELSKVLPSSYDDVNVGRPTSGACLALRARMLMFAASPLFNGNEDFRDVVNKDGTPLFSQSKDNSKWERAAKAAKLVIDMPEYDLYKEYLDDGSIDALMSCINLFLTTPTNNKEIILAYPGKTNGLYEYHLLPRGSGWAGCISATQNVVDAFFMKNGLSIDAPGSGYVESGYSGADTYYDTKYLYGSSEKKAGLVTTAGTYNMYVNREPRFYANIRFHGEYCSFDDTKRTHNFLNEGKDGKPSHDSPIAGYQINKALNPSTRHGVAYPYKPGIIVRLAEMYLIYAEALLKSKNDLPGAIEQVNKVRARVGLGDLAVCNPGKNLTTDADALLEEILRERACELGLEDVRLFDMTRYKREDLFRKQLHGLKIYRNDGGGNTPWSGSTGNSSIYPKPTKFTHEAFPLVNPSRAWWSNFSPKWYLSAFPPSEVNKKYGLTQNPGWN